ncbi:MAG: PspA/IM30 family protein [Xanthobacteraceae bacterium]|nr:PspA/IM30 family protein [Xanthobacteraceae bacterium]
MSESVFLRVRRLLSARIEDSVDAMERANSDSTMRESIREVGRAIDDVRADKERAMARRLQAARQQEMIAKKVIELTDKARFALKEGRDELAEGAVARQIELEEQARQFDQVQTAARDEEAKLEESLEALRARKRQMEEALSAFMSARTEASLGGDAGHSNKRNVERAVERAEAAFDRAMTGNGGVRFNRGDVEAINRVAEIDGLQKQATVAERLAALRREVHAG